MGHVPDGGLHYETRQPSSLGSSSPLAAFPPRSPSSAYSVAVSPSCGAGNNAGGARELSPSMQHSASALAPHRQARPVSAAALLPPRPQAEYDRAAECMRAETERMVAESAPVLVPVEAHTFELPHPRTTNTFPNGRERLSTAGSAASLNGRERELRELPVRLPAAGKDGAGRRMLPGKDGRLYKAGRGVSL